MTLPKPLLSTSTTDIAGESGARVERHSESCSLSSRGKITLLQTSFESLSLFETVPAGRLKLVPERGIEKLKRGERGESE